MVRVIDDNGNFIRDEFIENLTDEKYVDGVVPQGFILPKWNGTEWVEGGMKPLPIDVPPTTEERLATLETNQTSIIETISEIVGV